MPRPIVLIALLVLAPLYSGAQSLSDSTEIDAYLKQTIATTKIPAVVAMVADADHVLYSGAFGSRDVANHAPVGVDSIFRIASMTKPVTSVAVMMLVEKGAIALDDPISKYLPGFEHPEVFVTFDPKDKSFTKRPAKSPITIRQLLTHTSGLGYAFSSSTLAALIGGDPNASATGFRCCTIRARNGPMARARAFSASSSRRYRTSRSISSARSGSSSRSR